MLDFTSALYLGMQHPSNTLQPWQLLTTGRPAVMNAMTETSTVANDIAALQGCEAAVIASSTLHIFQDLFTMFDSRQYTIHVDAGAYPIAKWGIERAMLRGVQVFQFQHHDVKHLRRQLYRASRDGFRPLVVADGLCPRSGEPAPVRELMAEVKKFQGRLILDDTQALGILGHSPSAKYPFGLDGGGSLRWHQVYGPEVLLISSLAKGFGAPLATLSGSEAMIRWFKRRSLTRIHCSPSSAANLQAAENALRINRHNGDKLRRRLYALINRFKNCLKYFGLSSKDGQLPLQTLRSIPNVDAATLHNQMHYAGIRTLLLKGCRHQGPQLGFLITVRHKKHEIEKTVQALAIAIEKVAPNPFTLGETSC